jgi:hypothetical protein
MFKIARSVRFDGENLRESWNRDRRRGVTGMPATQG